MSAVTKNAVLELLNTQPSRILTHGKELTLALGDLYIAQTTLKAKPKLVWEGDSNYARYYVPFSSLHSDIRNGNGSNSSVSLKIIETVSGTKEPISKAVIEELTVGSRSTTWVRFLEGPLKDHVRFERNEIDAWFEDGKIFGGIKNPFKRIDTAPVSRHILVKVDGEVVAETNSAVSLFETGIGELYYLPATSIKNWGAIEKSDLRTVCPYKGEAWYFSLTVRGEKHKNLIWYYPYPTHESAGVEGFISFYKKDFVEVIVDGERT